MKSRSLVADLVLALAVVGGILAVLPSHHRAVIAGWVAEGPRIAGEQLKRYGLPERWQWSSLAAARETGSTGEPQKRDGPAPAEAAVPITSAVAQLEPLPTLRSGVGWIEPVATVKLRARIEGEIVERLVKDGQTVAAGDVLFRIDDSEIRAQIARDEAALARDQATLSRVQADLDRNQELRQRHVASQALVEQLAADAKVAAANVAASEAALRASRIRLAYTVVKAPISGRVGTVRATVGDLVGPGDAATGGLLTITQMKPVQVTFSLPERDIDLVRAALAKPDRQDVVRVFTGDSQIPAATDRISFMESTVDTGTGTIQIKALLPNEDGVLWPGQYARIEIQLGPSPNVISVPLLSVQTGRDGAFVFVIGDDGTVEARTIGVLETRGERAAVASGIEAGDRVVLEGHARLRDGTRVVEREPAAPSARAVAAGPTGIR